MRLAAKVRIDAGSYSGKTRDGNALTFFVPIGGRRLVNIDMPRLGVNCVPDGLISGRFVLASATIRPGGVFRGRHVEHGILYGSPATFIYSFSGRFSKTGTQPTSAAGSFREDVSWKDATSNHKCTTNLQTWTAARSGAIPKASNLLRPGAYTGRGSYSGAFLTFSVAGNSLQNFSVPNLAVYCTHTTYLGDHLQFASVAIRRNGSFSATARQSGVFAGAPAKFTYWLSGTFQGPGPSVAATAAGQYREDIVYTDSSGVPQSCSTNDESWTASRP